eukprot:767566-Hanusia_phi.AAC.9
MLACRLLTSRSQRFCIQRYKDGGYGKSTATDRSPSTYHSSLRVQAQFYPRDQLGSSRAELVCRACCLETEPPSLVCLLQALPPHVRTQLQLHQPLARPLHQHLRPYCLQPLPCARAQGLASLARDAAALTLPGPGKRGSVADWSDRSQLASRPFLVRHSARFNPPVALPTQLDRHVLARNHGGHVPLYR